MNIAIVGRFSPPILACIRSWGRKGHRVGFVNFADEGELKPRSRYLASQVTLALGLLHHDEGIEKIAHFLKMSNADILSCIDDKVACWMYDNRAAFGETVRLAIPPTAVIQRALSKTRQNKVARNVGLNVLPEYHIHAENKRSITIPENHFPLCLRPSVPAHCLPSFKARVIKTPDALSRFLQSMQIKPEGILIAQPFKQLPNLVVHGIRTTAGYVKRLFGFMVERKFEGVTLTLRPVVDLDADLMDKCAQFVSELDLVGHFHFEFLFDPQSGDAFFLEINHRFGGTTAKVLACGYDEPQYALEAYGFARESGSARIRQRTISNKQALLKYMGKALAGRLTHLDYPVETKGAQLKAAMDGFMTFGDEVMARDDLIGTVSLYGNNLIQILKVGLG